MPYDVRPPDPTTVALLYDVFTALRRRAHGCDADLHLTSEQVVRLHDASPADYWGLDTLLREDALHVIAYQAVPNALLDDALGVA